MVSLFIFILTLYLSVSGEVLVLSKMDGTKFCSIVYDYRDYKVFLSSTSNDLIMNISTSSEISMEETFYFANSAYVYTEDGYASFKPTIFTDAGIGIHIGSDMGFLYALFAEKTFYIEVDNNNFKFKPRNFRNLSYQFDECSKEYNS